MTQSELLDDLQSILERLNQLEESVDTTLTVCNDTEDLDPLERIHEHLMLAIFNVKQARRMRHLLNVEYDHNLLKIAQD
jgi:hypothetical protein